MKKTYVRFLDNETQEYLSYEFGRCDREQKCGYFKTAGSNETIVSDFPVLERHKPSFLSLKHVDHYFDLNREKQNRFIQFLYGRFNRSDIDRVVRDYLISTCFKWGGGATIFWQIDQNEKVRSGQVILYDQSTGKRIKNPFNHVTWVHSILEKEGEISGFVLEQCLFGLHLMRKYPDKKIVSIVEAPKTACIMSALFPKYLWMATCGLSNIKPEMFRPLKEKAIVLYPDLGAFGKWQEKAGNLREFGYKVGVSDLLEKKAVGSTPGVDIADFFINEP